MHYKDIKLIKDSEDLEIFASSYYQSINYYVENNLKWIEDKKNSVGNADILEIDILARMFTIDSVDRSLIECKRGCTYNDIYKFSGVAKMIGANSNIIICQGHNIDMLKEIGTLIEIQVKTPEELLSTLSNEQQLKMSFFYVANNIGNQLFRKELIKSTMSTPGNFSSIEKRAYSLIRSYMSVLIGKIWRVTDLVQQAIEIKKLLDDNSDFVRKIARLLKIKPGDESSEIYMNKNMLCRAAGYLVLKVRIAYVVCAIHCAVALENSFMLDLDRIQDESFLNVVALSRKKLSTAIKIPHFLQEFIYIFGGMTTFLDDDINNIAQYMKTNVSEIKEIIGLLKQLFKLTKNRIQWEFIEDMMVTYLKYVPNPIKGLGIRNREKLSWPIRDFCFADQWKKSLNFYKI